MFRKLNTKHLERMKMIKNYTYRVGKMPIQASYKCLDDANEEAKIFHEKILKREIYMEIVNAFSKNREMPVHFSVLNDFIRFIDENIQPLEIEQIEIEDN